MKHLYCVLCLMILGATLAGATTIHVPGDQATIQAALALAVEGDSVVVAAGTYSETMMDTDTGPSMLILPAGVFLIADGNVTLDAQHAGRVLLCIGGGSSGIRTVAGFTFVKGEADSFSGGAIALNLNAHIMIDDCRFEDNSAMSGGAIDTGMFGTLNVQGSTFESNTSTSAGGAISTGWSDLTVEDCEFLENQSVQSSGGAISANGGDISFRATLFQGNNSGSVGGALAISWNVNGSKTAEDCHFKDNHSDALGGAVFGNLRLTNCFLEGNTAPLGGWAGISNDTGMRFTNCTLVGDPSNPASGGLWHANSAGFSGFRVTRSILTGAGGTFISCDVPDAYNPPRFECSNVWGNAEGDWTEECMIDLLGVDGNISADPMFCNPNAGNFSINANSPCSPANSECGELIGAFGIGCGLTATQETSISAVKSHY